MTADQMTRDEVLYRAYARGMTYQAIAAAYGLSVDGVRGRVGRYRRKLERGLAPPANAPLALTGDWLIAGDVHLPAANNVMVDRFLAVGRRWLRRPRRCIIAGDLINAEAFSLYEPVVTAPEFGAEVDAGRVFFRRLLRVFDQVVVLPGNHDRRVSKRTRGALTFAHLIRLMTNDPRVTVSSVGYAIVRAPTGQWRVTHGSQYSPLPLAQADKLAQKHGQHIIAHHEHHLGIGTDRYGRHIVVNGGGLFDVDKLPYVWLDDSTRPAMVGGFTLLMRGYPYVFGQWTDWDFWLRKE